MSRATGSTRERRRSTRLALAALVAIVALLFQPLPPAHAGVGFAVVPDFPTSVTVGQSNPATLTITNISDVAEAVGASP